MKGSLLMALAVVRESFIDLQVSLNGKVHVAKVSSGLDIRNYESGVVVEIYVDVVLAGGISVVVWLEAIQNDGSWDVCPSLRLICDPGESVLELDTSAHHDEESLAVGLVGRAEHLLKKFAEMDLEDVKPTFPSPGSIGCCVEV